MVRLPFWYLRTDVVDTSLAMAPTPNSASRAEEPRNHIAFDHGIKITRRIMSIQEVIRKVEIFMCDARAFSQVDEIGPRISQCSTVGKKRNT